ncbi:MAG: DUF5107 domain-containing protein [Verrucomicrobiota bacterium]
MSVTARLEPRVIPTYPVGAPEKNPVFFEKRVYQGSNGKVYPVPFVDKVFDEPVDVTYQSALLENDFVRLVMLPEIGGRIFIGQDKSNNDYDFFYRQDVIKPALVGLAGPWISGGVEFNWPQHHRPGTFLPADVHIEEEADGARTVWMSEHDPLNRLKGMHGIRLRPGSSLIELRARLYNRTPFIHTFLWWANVAAEVHDQYQSFFPPDVHYVADHAVRATSSFPIANNPYYGIDYQNRTGANDLGWYKNIPVPTSYMVCQTAFDFFGGYDFSKNGGFVHVANRHIAPGKKQWTWGNHEFGYAWDRELTDQGGPYIELMAGVYTDNQPDFSYLLPYETKTFSQFWWPIQNIGPVQQANEHAALACTVRDDRAIALGLCVSSPFTGKLIIRHNDGLLETFAISLKPGEAWQNNSLRFTGENAVELSAELRDETAALVLGYRPVDNSTLTRERENATEPPAPADISSADELFFTGEHLEQYRHPTRSPEDYWNEALARDPGDARCHLALGKRALNRGELANARGHFEASIARLTSRHPNPVTGEAHYHLGLVLKFLGHAEAAYRAFYKATWNYEWRSSSYYQLAAFDCRKHDWKSALEHLEASLETNRSHNKAHVLKALVLRQVAGASDAILSNLLAVDPLDHWATHVKEGGIPAATRNDAQTILDLAFDYAEAGFLQEAIDLLGQHHAMVVSPVAVPNPLERTAMTHYALAWLKHITAAPDAAESLANARAQSADHFFPSRLEEMLILEWAAVEGPSRPASSLLPSGQDGPSTFTPTYLQPHKEIKKHGTSLPHWQQDNATYAVTFRLADSLPQKVIKAYSDRKQELESQLSRAQTSGDETLIRDIHKHLADLFQTHLEPVLNQGHGSCSMRDPKIARIVADAIRHFDGDRYDLAAWCVMPNHVHLILRPHSRYRLQEILSSIKSFSANEANKVIGKNGAFWQADSYDHIIRDADDFASQRTYLLKNPAVSHFADWPWVSAKPVLWNVEGSSRPALHVEGFSRPNSSNPTGQDDPSTPAKPSGQDGSSTYALGNFYFDKRRHADAIAAWEQAVAANTTIPQVYRNLAIAIWNYSGDGKRAAALYDKARALDPADARLVSESDQLAKKRNRPTAERLAFLEAHRDLVSQRDDATVELAALLNLSGRAAEALDLVTSRRFHPWEGGEGAVLRQYTAAHLFLGAEALENQDAAAAHKHFTKAMETPASLGEAYHPLQAKADVNYWIGRSLEALGRKDEARAAFEASAAETGDFAEMSVASHSPLSYYRGLSLRALGRETEATALFASLRDFAESQLGKPAKIDYFATSLPNLLVFDESLQARRDSEARLLLAMATLGLGDGAAFTRHATAVREFAVDDLHLHRIDPTCPKTDP